MIHDQIEFHNVAELATVPGANGLAMYRYPSDLFPALTPQGNHMAATSTGVELRFVSAPSLLALTLSARSNTAFSAGAKVEIFRGDLHIATEMIPDGATRTLKLTTSELQPMRAGTFDSWNFAPDLWRVVCSGATVFYHGLNTAGQPCRPPRAGEVPEKRWLAYGSSITYATPGYASHAARHLGVDLINKGLAGSCNCEPELVDYLASLQDWDFATLEICTNMADTFSEAGFEERARYLVTTLRAAAPDKPLVLITMFPTGNYYVQEPNDYTKKGEAFRKILRTVAADLNDPLIHLIEGNQVGTNLSQLSPDLLHPTPDGHQDMGANLAVLLRSVAI